MRNLKGSELLNGLDLFSGIGGISLALSKWVRPVTYCESDRYAQAVLLSRMSRRELGWAPIWDDVRTLRASAVLGVDIVYGGFPCQDISSAGAGRGLAGERSGLVVEIFRLVQGIRPAFVFLENVPAIRTRGLGRVGATLAGLGYDCRWTVVSAEEVGAPHLRKRWFMLAHSRGELIRDESGRSRRPDWKSPRLTRNDGAQESMAAAGHTEGVLGEAIERAEPNTNNDRAEAVAVSAEFAERAGLREPEPAQQREVFGDRSGVCGTGDGWSIEPSVGRVAHGIPQRVDRLRGLGNAVVPLQARTAFKRLMGLDSCVESGG